MNADATDDLHAAEDLISTLTRAVEIVLVNPSARVQAVNAAMEGETWCRPTCGWRDGEPICDIETCGCPCNHEPGGVTI